MTEEVIKTIQPLGDPWQSSHGTTMHTFGVTMESGARGVANSTTDSPWWQPGTKVAVEEKGKTDNGNPRWSIKKPDYAPPSGEAKQWGGNKPRQQSGGGRTDQAEDIRRGRAANNAVHLYTATKLAEEGLAGFNVEELAHYIKGCYDAEVLAFTPHAAPAQQNETNNDETPF